MLPGNWTTEPENNAINQGENANKVEVAKLEEGGSKK